MISMKAKATRKEAFVSIASNRSDLFKIEVEAKIDHIDFDKLNSELYGAIIAEARNFYKFTTWESYIINILAQRPYGVPIPYRFILLDPYRDIFTSFFTERILGGGMYNDTEWVVDVMFGRMSIRDVANKFHETEIKKVRGALVSRVMMYKKHLMTHYIDRIGSDMCYM